ncbi:MAG: phosphatidylserine decarboxylase, partial [Gammaproteobacteria bacterium]|nr:phosphatidylserine decarboxylase [Gammaproteobacteria bacterium]
MEKDSEISRSDKLFAAWQYLVPHHLLSRLMGFITHSDNKWIKLAYMKFIIKRFGVNMDEAMEQDLDRFEHFNAFFTRELKPEARPIHPDKNILVSPVDGCVSQMGLIRNGKI